MSVLALFVFLFTANPAKAQQGASSEHNVGSHGVGLGLGQTILMSDFSKNFSDSLGYNLDYDYEASEMFGLHTVISYSNHSDGTGANSLSIFGVTPNLKVNLAYIDKLVLYTYGGFGLFKITETVGQIKGGITTFAFDMGIGANLVLDKHFQFGPSISFHNIFGKTDTAATNTGNPTALAIGGTYLGLFLNAMYIF